ncbi:acylneuraminate cytidylyltransferase [Aneurinibacillus migulanus]|uniref:cytidylyltransferase domain-containing protein n=1 Tax=Aneurinibacillus migulanus TaxID=47500 RepID=UPI0005BA2CC4|nr:glycosyltransferase family protein [Aneurinibacillus migulanus]KIV53470.1 acylneuraminate cytidylyltransferase [Aneurinibacillus migulanus]KPD07437.1 acylneuraminate cytidylyltransferase [Aneurinibacillus migulanus]MCP1357545.1 glycosyltransferase family protein [Aneurinibacillus migulanus]CEH30585.1 Acylneuraminate cytidylyltransferase [Aneurinibacillus migulanus]
MKTILIIQARMGSSRLPGKILKPLGDTVELDYVVSRCRQVQGVDDVIVATSVLSQDDEVEVWCRKQGVTCYRGSEDDVLDRYYSCARTYRPDYVIRVTADCPFIDYQLGSEMVETMKCSPCDIVMLEGVLPRGLAMEIVSFAALEYMHTHGNEERHREHVTYYAYEYPERFRTVTLTVPNEIRHPQLRITLDTKEDYAMLTAVAEEFKGDMLVPAKRVVQYLLNHPDIAAINAHVEQKPVI